MGLSPALVEAANLPAQSSAGASPICGTGYALTPEGCAPQTCIHVLNDDNATVSQEQNGDVFVQYSDGQTTTFPPCQAGDGPQFSTNGWVEAAYDNVATTQMSGKWQVPSSPTTNDGQTIFIFDGTENGPQTDIIQPVIQWGPSAAGGGAFWALASWYVTSSGSYLVSKLIGINAGDAISGSLTASGCVSGTCSWVIKGEDTTLGTKTVLSVKGIDAQTHAVVTLEVYGVSKCSDYPASGESIFKGLSVNSAPPTSWTKLIFQNDGCGEKITAKSTKVSLFY